MATTGFSGPLATGKTMASEDFILDALTIGKYLTCATVDCESRGIILKPLQKCPKCGNTGKPVEAVYIETEPDTLYESRMVEMAAKRGIKIDLNNLYVCPAEQIPTMKAQFLQYKLIQKQLEKGANIHLVVIDSFNANIRAGWGLTNMLPIRSRELAEHFNLIKYLAATYNIAWVLTCQVISAPRPDQQHSAEAKFGSKNYPVGGDILLHSVNQWVAVDQVKGSLYSATLFDSSYLPKREVNFQLTAKGLADGVA
jgi:RecA/RadA recombinase